MHTLLAVLTDLLLFIREQLFGPVPRALPAKPTDLQLVEPRLPALLPASQPKSVVAVPQVVPPQGNTPGPNLFHSCVGEPSFFYIDPTIAFDNVLCPLPYGTALSVGARSGRFVHATLQDGTEGYVLYEVVREAGAVLPVLVRGHRYFADDAATQAVRAFILDTFGGERAHLPLMPEEYVTYRLRLGGAQLPWPVTHGRVAGTWARKLRGVHGVHIDVQPRTGAVMEYIIDEVGYLAYVTKVSPDLTLTVEGIGLTFEAQFTEQVLKERDWRELHPLFITLR